MTATSTTPSGPSATGHSSGPFILTLCSLEGPVSIRPSQSAQLQRFTFFTTCVRQHDGAEQVYLHMGYFQTLIGAQSLLQAVRRRFPQAIAVPAPAAVPQASYAPIADESLSDTQVMEILAKRGGAPAEDQAREGGSAEIGLLRPEDTSTRRALKEAVVAGAPVSFAVQLDWSDHPINPDRVRPLTIFKTHTLYATATRRQGHCRYFLRLGFFADAASAREAALSVRSKFASAVVVPVTEEEITRAHEASTEAPGFAAAHSRIDPASEPGRTQNTAPQAKRLAVRLRRRPQRTETLEQTLERLAAQEQWNDPDTLSESGVRHLKVQVLGRRSGGS